MIENILYFRILNFVLMIQKLFCL